MVSKKLVKKSLRKSNKKFKKRLTNKLKKNRGGAPKPSDGDGNKWEFKNNKWINNDSNPSKARANAFTNKKKQVDHSWNRIRRLERGIKEKKEKINSEKKDDMKMYLKKEAERWEKVLLPIAKKKWIESKPPAHVMEPDPVNPNNWGQPKVIEIVGGEYIYDKWWYQRCDARNPLPDAEGKCKKGKIPLDKFYKWEKESIKCCYSELHEIWSEVSANIMRCLRTENGLYQGYWHFGANKPYVPGTNGEDAPCEREIKKFFLEDVNREECKKVINSPMHLKFIKEIEDWIKMHKKNLAPNEYSHYHDQHLVRVSIERAEKVKEILTEFGKKERSQAKNELFNACNQKSMPEDVEAVMSGFLGPLYEAYTYKYKDNNIPRKTFREGKDLIKKIFSESKNHEEALARISDLSNETDLYESTEKKRLFTLDKLLSKDELRTMSRIYLPGSSAESS